MLVALKSQTAPVWQNQDKELNEYLGHRLEEEIVSEVPILTDDFAPVDNYLLNTYY